MPNISGVSTSASAAASPPNEGSIYLLIEKCGLIAVFVGCLAEGESAAILGGFFAHQNVFVPWQAFAAAFLGAFGGDALFFSAGRRFAEHPFVVRLRHEPGFTMPIVWCGNTRLYVLLNRYAYGFRLIGGVAAGLSGIAVSKFLILNALSAFVWVALFGGIGYVLASAPNVSSATR